GIPLQTTMGNRPKRFLAFHTVNFPVDFGITLLIKHTSTLNLPLIIIVLARYLHEALCPCKCIPLKNGEKLLLHFFIMCDIAPLLFISEAYKLEFKRKS